MAIRTNANTVETMSFNKIKVKIFNRFVIALVDTGCALSVLSERLIKKLHLDPLHLDPGDPPFLFGANGTKIGILGKI